MGQSTRGPSARRVLVSVCAVTTAGVLPVFLLGGLAVQIRDDLDLSKSAQGQAIFGFFIISAITSAWSGRLTERLGSAVVMRTAALAGAISSLGVGTAQSLPLLTCALAVGGLANALAQPAANALVVRSIAPHRQGLALGVKQSAIPMATLLAGLAVPTVALTVGWRWSFIVATVLSVIAAFTVPAAPTSSRAAPVRSRVEMRAARQQGDFEMTPLIVLGVGVCLGSAMANALGAFVTSSAVEAGIDAGAAGLLLALGSALGLTLRITSGWMADRRSEHLPTVAVMLVGGGVGLAGLSTGEPVIIVAGTLLAFGSGWSWPGVFNLAVVTNYADQPARATGLTQTGAYLGGAIGPLIMGLLVDSYSYRAAWLAFMLVACTSAAVMMIGRRLLTPSVSQALSSPV